jgi:endoglucanase
MTNASRLLGLVGLIAAGWLGCIPKHRPGTTPARAPGQSPFAGLSAYVDPSSSARRQAEAWRQTRAEDADAIDRIAREPHFFWFGDWNQDVAGDVRARVDEIDSAGALALLVAYNIPNRDCGNYSAGGASGADAYQRWIRRFASGVGARRAVVVLEPDALGLLKDCLSPADQEARLAMIADAVDVLQENRGTAVYIDAGNAKWSPAPEMADRLSRAGVARAEGFALNVSNYVATAETIAYGEQISARVSGKHFIIDTSRNGNGPTADLTWCNPDGRALGEAPTTRTASPLVDAYVWVKIPGESDGTCNGGPRAGEWWPKRALELARNAKR